ncbi:hypothetical protein [Marinomonas sp. IMCC 4694]|uniref:hypothetical protein n=1 Tax=Marinomonas sp. IMCC 4694 TaxID=2605432 RepID=UPI0011E882F8|nr:hypothetical protein [Marinomonas sp. IMCC 4694]TYL48553.1 hypothetical protein FXV75_11745 [Marinomonas sp. IMCC 4694]TYL48560.1 hypothetical protein FXV75_11780 [Marinomonas sp. IMCC 4694]
MSKYQCKKYVADSRRGDGSQKVISFLLTSPEDILDITDNFILNALDKENLSSAIGTYFYRFKNDSSPFIKIGECTRKEGISVRFKRGWHGTKKYSDSYLGKIKGNKETDSRFFMEINKISSENPAYFVFYEHCLSQSYPKIDEIYAYRTHRRLYKKVTLSPERMNGNAMLARKLIWHKSAFSEVFRCKFPDGSEYG